MQRRPVIVLDLVVDFFGVEQIEDDDDNWSAGASHSPATIIDDLESVARRRDQI
jgi:hypothetical protein